MEKKTVFIVMYGEINEGGWPVAVFNSREKAQRCALKQKTHFAGGWKKAVGLEDYWKNGCDFVAIEKRVVR